MSTGEHEDRPRNVRAQGGKVHARWSLRWTMCGRPVLPSWGWRETDDEVTCAKCAAVLRGLRKEARA